MEVSITRPRGPSRRELAPELIGLAGRNDRGVMIADAVS